MIKELGQISKVEIGGVWVNTIQQSTCNACQAKHGCGQKLLNQIGAFRSSIWASLGSSVELSDELSEGDWVEIGIAEGAVVLGSLLAYGLPVLLLVVGAALGQSEPFMAMSGALLGLLIGASFSRVILRGFFAPQYFQPVVLAKATAPQQVKLIGL